MSWSLAGVLNGSAPDDHQDFAVNADGSVEASWREDWPPLCCGRHQLGDISSWASLLERGHLIDNNWVWGR